MLVIAHYYYSQNNIKYHRKPNCDQIFSGDPANAKLYVCKLCAKHVRSKWHHFQTHYSRDHKCSECDAVYSRIDTLRTHAKKRHQTVIPRYYCGIPANIWHRSIVKYAAAAAAAASTVAGPSRAPAGATRDRPTKSGTPPVALQNRAAGN
ncbi:Zinc finger C2H2-type [Cinara cedri]|uniref:Zinc finger C2H2-type n=1 Tax=Cinara cedri TaxID=506608 RepID=A0A5E4MN27_9HEMI|nr:Zinc finger C2H2-type [Cinara cedri]